jgi:hypothetical protein
MQGAVGRLRSIVIAVGAAVTVLTLPGVAHAANAEHVEWSGGSAYSYCESGLNSRVCYYDLYISCTEAAAVGAPLASCWVEMHAAVRVVPVFNAAGRVVGCSSVGLDPSWGGYVDYDSSFNEFDNHNIASPFTIAVHDVFADGKPGAAELVAISQGEQEGGKTWIVTGDFVASCARNADFYSGTTTGTVDVDV